MQSFGETYSEIFSRHFRLLRLLIPIAVWAAICGFPRPDLADGDAILRKTCRGLRSESPASGQHWESLRLALDRDTMASVLLQWEAQPADSLLPQSLSGYAFLFESSMNLQRARELRAAFPAGVPARFSHCDCVWTLRASFSS